MIQTCVWCDRDLPATARSDAFWCSKRCRQSAFRLRRRRDSRDVVGDSTFAYADPPYPGKARKYYQREPDFAGEVDHEALVSGLERRRLAGELRGYAISTGGHVFAPPLPFLALLPPFPLTHVCPWVKPGGVPKATRGLHLCWEAVIVVGGRREPPGMRDWLEAHPARGRGTLMGRKPIAFCAFLFDALGLLPGDVLEDLFPGTRAVGRAWEAVCAEGFAHVAASSRVRPPRRVPRPDPRQAALAVDPPPRAFVRYGAGR